MGGWSVGLQHALQADRGETPQPPQAPKVLVLLTDVLWKGSDLGDGLWLNISLKPVLKRCCVSKWTVCHKNKLFKKSLKCCDVKILTGEQKLECIHFCKLFL